MGQRFAYRDSLRRLHLVRVDHASSAECVATIVESLDARAIGAAVHCIPSELHDPSVFDEARTDIVRGTVALRQASEIALAAQIRAAGRRRTR